MTYIISNRFIVSFQYSSEHTCFFFGTVGPYIWYQKGKRDGVTSFFTEVFSDIRSSHMLDNRDLVILNFWTFFLPSIEEPNIYNISFTSRTNSKCRKLLSAHRLGTAKCPKCLVWNTVRVTELRFSDKKRRRFVIVFDSLQTCQYKTSAGPRSSSDPAPCLSKHKMLPKIFFSHNDND